MMKSKRKQPGGRRDRRGTVLIMVVALLSILFVVGTAFLNTVTFEGKSIDAAEEAQVRDSVVANILREVGTELRDGFVGQDGAPFNQDAPSNIGNDMYGEVPGVHPLIASLTPYQGADTLWVFYGHSDLERAIEDQWVAVDGDPNYYYPPVIVSVELDNTRDNDDSALDFPDEGLEGDSFYDEDAATNSLFYRRDADGDGVPDTYEHRLPPERYPAMIRGGLPGQLRADDADTLGLGDLDDLYYAVRIISHGGMANLGHGHRTILETLLGTSIGTGGLGEFVPGGEEATLRRRFLLPPADVPLTELQGRESAIGESLYGAFVNDIGDFKAGDEDAQWWGIDTGTNGQDVSGITGASGWLEWVNPANLGTAGLGAYRYLLTTISHDDQLMRMGRVDATADWIDEIVAIETGGGDLFKIDEWPNAADPDDPLNGRLKVSLPGLVKSVLLSSSDPTLQNNGIDGLGDTLSSNGVADRTRFVATIQDAFTLMLRNVDTGVLADDDKWRAAAALTANLIDFADSDADGVPTWVEVVKTDGDVTGEVAYGVERQPFITEVYGYSEQDTSGVAQELRFAIELYNPYDTPINLAGYSLNDAESANSRRTALNEPRLFTTSLGALTIPAGEFVWVYAAGGGVYTLPLPAPIKAGTALGGGGWALDSMSRVELVRTVPTVGGGTTNIVVDAFSLARSGLGDDRWGQVNEVTVERDTTGVAVGQSNWRFTVPISGTVVQHSLGDYNNFVDATIKPVLIDFANTGDIETAFPTTGSLLLLSRYAHMDDGTGGLTPFNADLATNPDRIDNGRMPIFDQNQLADGTNTGPFDLRLPWGQLLFDYFTALPLSHTRDSGPDDMIPTVDQNGVRVHGRIDLNSAPWPVLEGLPMVPMVVVADPEQRTLGNLPASIRTKIAAILSVPDDSKPTAIGPELAQSIVAYREKRLIGSAPDNTSNYDIAGGGNRLRNDGGGNSLTGFLTVGELANVRSPDDGVTNQSGNPGLFDIDAGVIDATNPTGEDYIEAVAVLVALGDWVTTRSHVFTVYGTLRGAGSKSGADRKALRFQQTVDRLPTMFSNALPRPIGQTVISSYADARGD